MKDSGGQRLTERDKAAKNKTAYPDEINDHARHLMRVGRFVPIASSLGSHYPSASFPGPSDVHLPHVSPFSHHPYINQAPRKSQKPQTPVRTQPNCDVAPVLLPPHSSQWLPSTTIDHLDSRDCLESVSIRGDGVGYACIRDPLLPRPVPCRRP